ncbi:hypothetical protein ACFXPX_35380 [Kitasatospora sp. NPDC059146]|uniref:hypothetical protein n=1 Tax=unclassified Kitasatospora TaxID=2633591 RepID=UPI003691776D
MTTTSDVPDHATAEQRWQRLQDQLDQVADRTRAEIDTAIASIDACLARLAALRQHLTDRP